MFFGLRSTVLLSLFIFSVIYCLQVIPERANVTYINENYIEYAKFTIKRYGRRSGYYMNVEGSIKHAWSNNISIDLIFFEYLHNEYRRSFIEMHFKVCDFIKKEVYIGSMLASKGVKCPIPKGEYHLMNMTIPAENFPHVFPFAKGRVEMQIIKRNETMVKFYLEALFKNNIKKTQ